MTSGHAHSKIAGLQNMRRATTHSITEVRFESIQEENMEKYS